MPFLFSSVFTFHALAYKILWEHVKKLAGQPNADMPQAAYESLLNLGLNADSTTDAVDINVVGSRESLLIVDKRKMDKVLEQLHAEEGAAANRRGIQPPQPTIQELAKAFDLANLISTCRNHGIAPPLQPVQDLIVDTDLDLANLVQPLSDPPVPCPTDFDTLFEWSGINFKERGKKFPEFSEEELEQRVKTVLGMALRRSLGSVLKPGQSQYVVDYEVHIAF